MMVRNARTGKDVRLTRAMKLFASEREVVDEAFAGDVVGLANPGIVRDRRHALQRDAAARLRPDTGLRAGTLRRRAQHRYGAATNRSARASRNCAKRARSKSLYVEGQIRSEPIFAAVGELQFEVAKYRLEAEYGVKTQFAPLPYALARHVDGTAEALSAAKWPSNARLTLEAEGRAVALFESEWSLRLAAEWNPALRFVEFGADVEPTEVSGA